MPKISFTRDRLIRFFGLHILDFGSRSEASGVVRTDLSIVKTTPV